MKQFTSVKDVEDPMGLVREALTLKRNPRAFHHLGKGLTLGLIFMNPSLRTRLSTQKAALNLGMEVMVMNVGSEGWNLETNEGIIMNGKNAEHVREAAPVIGQYCDVIGIRSLPKLKDQSEDYSDSMVNAFIQYSGKPVISLESAVFHPLQSLADLVTIEELKTTAKPKIVLTWAPHSRALPQSVSNSFVQWIQKTNYDFVITHPEGYELSPEIAGDTPVEYDQQKAFDKADFIYAKNWSSFKTYGQVLSRDNSWIIDEAKMSRTNNGKFMHCLPVRRNLVVTDGVLDSKHSVVIQQAGNRECSAQAVLKALINELKPH